MSDAAAKPKAKKAAKPKKPAAHPKYSEMIKAAITALKDRGGSSRQAILKYILKHYKVGDEKVVNAHLKMALRAGVAKKTLKQAKGTGASGSFRLGEEAKAKKPKKAKKAKKPAAKKTPKKPKKPKKAKKPAAKKSPKKAKKPAAKKAKKPAAKKSPKKKAAKPKKAKK